MTVENMRRALLDYCIGRPCSNCKIKKSCKMHLPSILIGINKADNKIVEILYNELTGGKTMKPETTENNTITISRSEYGRLRTAEAELEARQRESSNTVTLDRSEYNMLIKAQGLLYVVRTSYKTASADYRLCEFLDILFADKEGSNG